MRKSAYENNIGSAQISCTYIQAGQSFCYWPLDSIIFLVAKFESPNEPHHCICKNKGADQLHSHCAADQHLCFCYIDSTITLLSKSKISSL